MLASHTVDVGSNLGSSKILTRTALVDLCQSNITSTTSKRLTSSLNGLDFCFMFSRWRKAPDRMSLSALCKLFPLLRDKLLYDIIKINAF